MHAFDLSPLFRSAVGFDRTSRLLNSAFDQLADNPPSYPPYDIEKTAENEYRITMAVAGFSDADIDITLAENQLTIKGLKAGNEKEARGFLHHGIANRAFERGFQLADYIVVSQARLENGLLEIDLVRELPEAMKPRKIEIGRGKAKRLIRRAAA